MPQPGGNTNPSNPFLPYPAAGGNFPPYPTSNFGGFPGYPGAGGNGQPSSGYPPYMPNSNSPSYNNFYGGVSANIE